MAGAFLTGTLLPIIGVILAVIAVVALLIINWNKIKKAMEDIGFIDFVKNAWQV